ncbi:MAG TPA: gas vesicle protein GvpO [Bacillota bacterium]|nr:gas vesicle protein GvpO [Bacillota bacterium]
MDFDSNCRKSEFLTLVEVIAIAKTKVSSLTGFQPLAVVEANSTEAGNWNLKVEFVEREAIPSTMDLIGLYEVNLDRYGEVIGYSRLSMRKRGEGYDN